MFLSIVQVIKVSEGFAQQLLGHSICHLKEYIRKSLQQVVGGEGVKQRDYSSLTTASYPFSAAHDSGVRPYRESFESTSTFSVASSSLTTASWPFSAAHDSGVRPYQ